VRSSAGLRRRGAHYGMASFVVQYLGELGFGEYWPSFFDELATEVSDVSIACEWEIPDPPDNQALVANQVNVEFVDGDGVANQIGYVESEADCEDEDEKQTGLDDCDLPGFRARRGLRRRLERRCGLEAGRVERRRLRLG